MKDKISYPKKYSLLDELEMEYLEVGWWYKGHNWNNKPLYARSMSRKQYSSGNTVVNWLLGVVAFASGFGGPVGMAIGTAITAGTIVNSGSALVDGRWNRAVNYCFQDGKHSNFYFTAFMKNNTFLGYGDEWIYTN